MEYGFCIKLFTYLKVLYKKEKQPDNRVTSLYFAHYEKNILD